MTKELVIRSNTSDVDFAILTDGELVELHKEESSKDFTVGDIMFARVKKNVRGLNASFVDLGYEKDAFLHHSGLGRNIRSLVKFVKLVNSGKLRSFDPKNFQLEPVVEKDEDVSDVLKVQQSTLVQIVKEPISSKGPRITCEISIAGRYLVLVPFSNKVSVSQKISDEEERKRLLYLIKSIRPPGFGVIIRTVAKGKMVIDLDADLNYILERWQKMCKKLSHSKPPSRVLKEVNKVSSILRDMFDDTFSAIHVNDEDIYYQIREQLLTIAPNKENIVKYYKSKTPIFEKFGVERQIKSSFGRVVSMSKGAYLVIEHTEALHVIDVNSGRRSNNGSSQQDTAIEVNMIAAKEIAKQLRLRDMGGIIVVDFIDINSAEDRRKLYDFFCQQMATDRAKHKILPPSKFGLIQITRQRVRPERKIETQENIPKGGNRNTTPILLIDELSYKVEELIKNGLSNNGIVLNIHPFIAAYLKYGGLKSIRMRWFWKHKKWVTIIPRDAYGYLEYRFKDNEGTVLKLN